MATGLRATPDIPQLATGADVVILPTPDHLGRSNSRRQRNIADVETVPPRLSFARMIGGGRL